MKKLLLTVCTLLAAGAMLTLSAQEEKEMKTGWSFGLLPTATWSTDNGFQAGAFGDVYYYGDGSTYPDPLHKISWEASYFTHSHRMRLYLAYDSKYLIPNMRVNASVTYMNDPLYSFWGFNGPAAVQDYDLWSNRHTGAGHHLNYYGMSRDMLRLLANFQGRITDNLNWAAGVNFWRWKLGDMKDNGVKGAGDTKEYYKTDLTLYDTYIALGAITEAEKNGGNALELNAGLVFDTRDIEAAPNRGIWAEAYLNGNVLEHRYLKACAYFRHYIDIPIHIPAGDPVFAYRLAWQQTIAGETPFYMIQNIFAWANTELRVKLVNFKLFNQYFYIAVNPFFDAGVITKPYRTKFLPGAIYDEDLKDFDFTAYRKYLESDPKNAATLERFNKVHGAGYDGKIYDAARVNQDRDEPEFHRLRRVRPLLLHADERRPLDRHRHELSVLERTANGKRLTVQVSRFCFQ